MDDQKPVNPDEPGPKNININSLVLPQDPEIDLKEDEEEEDSNEEAESDESSSEGEEEELIEEEYLEENFKQLMASLAENNLIPQDPSFSKFVLEDGPSETTIHTVQLIDQRYFIYKIVDDEAATYTCVLGYGKPHLYDFENREYFPIKLEQLVIEDPSKLTRYDILPLIGGPSSPDEL